ncbi:MFS transporter [Mycetocola reblochoni]|uniref:MFS transporter n=2 Tax=Mycetocola reblochoni TaxID=331618 RepID=A0A3L6ZW25_9MICO|nr:MFS transporter [Mycetocola reblochoni]
MFNLAYGGNHFTPLLHLYEQAGGYTPWQANLLLGMYVGGLIPGLLLAAAISDKHGRKPVLVAGTVIALVGSTMLAAGLHTFVLLCVGRVLAGIGVGVAMSVGTSWIKELSSAPFDPDAPASAGARRPSMTLTFGFGLGAAVSGSLAQWGPVPTVMPYLVHIGFSIVGLALLIRAPESLPTERRATGDWWRDLRVPSTAHRKFLGVVLPAAPWVFAAAGVAYAVMPALVEDQLGDGTTVYATGLTVLTLGVGAAVQNLVPWINRVTGNRAVVVGLVLMTAGMALSEYSAVVTVPALSLAVAVLLGMAYGVLIVAGLIIVQRIATPQDLAGLTGVYYSLSYTGFLLPTVLSALVPVLAYPVSLTIVTGVCALSLLLVMRNLRR